MESVYVLGRILSRRLWLFVQLSMTGHGILLMDELAR
jgi:hypothetical protein